MTKKTQSFRKILIVLAVGSIAITASACNTVKGAGRDIESVGQAGDQAIN
jgi:entericidin B